MSALRLINETEVTSSVSSVDVTDVFSADFDIYKITMSDSDASANEQENFRFINSSGSVISASNYDYAKLHPLAYTTISESRATNQTRFYDWKGIGRSTEAENGGAIFYIFNPYSSSSYSFILQQASYQGTNGYIGAKSISVLKQTASMTGFQIFLDASATIDKILIRTYGLRVDS